MRKVTISLAFILSVVGYVDAQDTTRVRLLFLGDIMQHDSQIAAALDPKTGRYDYKECFKEMKPVFESADMTIGNLELSLGGPPYKGYPAFSAPDELIDALTWSGVDVLVTANNHCLDRGKKGLQRTIGVLDTLRIPHTGTFLDSLHRSLTYPLQLEQNGIRISLLNYTYGTNGIVVTKPNIVNYIDTTQIAMDIQKAKDQNPDVIIAFMHWGDEYQRLPNKAQKMVADFCFQRGVKLVIGAHPHVVQPMEWRKESDQLVAYSLGNFVSGQTSRYKNGGTMLYVDLMKIAGDSTTTKIEDASYKLQFIYRDAKKHFRIMPVPEFETDIETIREPLAQAYMKEFVSDSRALFDTHNVNIKEHSPLSVDSLYFIRVEQLDSLVANKFMKSDSLERVHRVFRFYGIENESDQPNNSFRVGEFFDAEVANRAMKELKASFPKSKVLIVKRRRH